MKQLIFHIDVNSAFLSWESIRRVKNGEVDLRLIPSVIGGSPESRCGVVLAKSIPAKQYNIKTGEPISMALRKCPALVIAPPNFKLYSACSKAFKDICRAYAPVVEEFSIDECFLDFTGTEHIYPDPITLAYEIKKRSATSWASLSTSASAKTSCAQKWQATLKSPTRYTRSFPMRFQ